MNANTDVETLARARSRITDVADQIESHLQEIKQLLSELRHEEESERDG